MDNEEKIEKIEEAITELESLKDMLKEEKDYRVRYFMETCMEAVFGDKVPYMLRCRLLDLYPEFTKKRAGGDEWYAFSFSGRKEFDRVIKEIKLWIDNDDVV